MNPRLRAAVLQSPDYPYVPTEAPVKLDQNEAANDFPPHLKTQVMERLMASAWNRYPQMNADELTAKIAQHDGWPESGVVVTTGSNVLIPLLIQLTALQARVVTVKPNFALYAMDSKLLGAALTEVPLNQDFSLDIPGLLAAIGDDAASNEAGEPGDADSRPSGVIFISQPHAPTGTLASLVDLERLAAASERWLLVIDEAYCHYAEPDAIELAKRHPNIMLLRTFSKAWGLAGCRIGYALSSDEVAKNLRKLAPPFGVSTLQAVAAQVALENPAYMREQVARTIDERERMSAALSHHPTWEVIPSSTNFLLIRTTDVVAAHQQLLSAGVLVRRQDSSFGLEGCFRVTVGTASENDAFLAAAGVSS